MPFRFYRSLDEVHKLFHLPLQGLTRESAKIHRRIFLPLQVQRSMMNREVDHDLRNSICIVKSPNSNHCVGNIFELSDSKQVRVEILHLLCTQKNHPKYISFNLFDRKNADRNELEFLFRTISASRILMPRSRINLTIPEKLYSNHQQTLLSNIGVNSIIEIYI